MIDSPKKICRTSLLMNVKTYEPMIIPTTEAGIIAFSTLKLRDSFDFSSYKITMLEKIPASKVITNAEVGWKNINTTGKTMIGIAKPTSLCTNTPASTDSSINAASVIIDNPARSGLG